MSRYQLIDSSMSVGMFAQFTEPDDKAAVAYARRHLYGARIIQLHRIEHTARGDVFHPVNIADETCAVCGYVNGTHWLYCPNRPNRTANPRLWEGDQR